MDWDSDPELIKIRKEFIESFRDRIEALRSTLKSLALAASQGQGAPGEEVVRLRYIAHKLGGTAASYGFPHLGDIAMKLDDRIDEFVESGDRAVNLERFPTATFIKDGEKLLNALISSQTGKDSV